jgi:DedD protein
MGLSSMFKRQGDAASAAPTGLAADASLVERARTSARRRLIGAVVLLGIGVVAFPLIFETQPRPIPVDIPIEIPRKEGLPPLAVPAPRPVAVPASRPAMPVITEPKVEAPSEPAPPAPAAEPKVQSKPETKPEPKPEPKAEPKPAVKAEAKPAARTEPAAKPADEAGRFVVQVGAFAETSAVRDARAKVEKIGLTTYTQVVETANGKRTRVRVGPFATRDEAEKAAARIKAAGLPGAVLTL